MRAIFIFLLGTIMFFAIGCEKDKKENVPIESKVQELLSKMTLEEKIGQLNLRGTSSRVKGTLPESLKKDVREGRIGAFLNVMNKKYVDELQRIAVEESPNKIPLIFSRDVIHGFKTIFPIPLGVAASWDQEVAKNSSRVAAIEASTFGVRWTFAPMLDIARDARWGRVAESPGEDPYLAKQMAKAYVEGFQGDSLSDPTSLIACAKHFIGYGAAIGGRDYNTAIISKEQLYNTYLPPFQSAFESGVQTVMTSFNEVNGIPASGDKELLSDILRKQLKFDGFVVSDWNSITEMIAHGYAEDEKKAAEKAINARLNMEMTSKSYEDNVKELLKEKKLSINQINKLVADILRVKIRMGLFENPYRNKTGKLYDVKHLELAKEAAIKSSVLLKNENNILPLDKNTKILIVGPLADKPREQLGTWTFDGDKNYTVTPVMSFKNHNANFEFIEGLTYSRDTSKKQFREVMSKVKKADVILFIGGEEAILSGEAHSRANINLPGVQEELIKELSKLKKPIILTIMAGRPITLQNIKNKVDGILMTWHPGTMGGDAIYEMVYGVEEPKGRLPITWPKMAGQLPLYYNHKNTGRPASAKEFVHIDSIPIGVWQSSLGNTSHYLDAGYKSEYPFGFGLGYTTFKYSNLTLSTNKLTDNGSITASIDITNTGKRMGSELVQLYIQDVVGSITRPVKELKGYKRISLKPHEKKKVSFKIKLQDLKYYNNQLEYGVEKGKFNVWIGASSVSKEKLEFIYE
ncbi:MULTISPECIES: glycoside hydrolase family 3 N-terminal domain-containing protein [unclassified Tenacibaculum]|uniref:glycoside hydrolase family 3 N-terminal domain-containing protein n=1 Tax=unclassified Tenacibaculum TaxID=2635139 RepID=UPI001F3BC4DE|nr:MULTISPECIES: glycoside hydrolase family 3 N-terminal domain-containing protein [unclassified Tenacibaculum]MCF2875025.1 glycoside hydrolase family 3 C-terminal domain-containing protein [Tenacibaculum sp. Cn5-1]MCF2935101.1 glycoside hydrolase family 3 C-terminal domain-containing protein [Tenacibaculum sp. Cn5-34]MCG7511457.1 glycoside hydrolase family 3 C-terminal domain-containing protein [Tenacibaculum sp. Cn5-46]